MPADRPAAAAAMPRPALWALALTLLFAAGSWLPAMQFFSRPSDYLALHMLMETVSVAVSAMIFGLAWSLRNEERNGLTVLLGTAFLAIGLIDVAHTLSYQGMPDMVTPASAEKAINFWLAARAIGALAFLAVGLWRVQRVSARAAGCGFVLALALTAVVWRIGLYHPELLPRTFHAGEGLTTFKIGAEYVLVALYGFAALLIARRARQEQSAEYQWLALAAWTLALAELFLTFYLSVTDIFNLLGHVYKTAAYLMVYRALFVTGVRAPQRALAAERRRVAELEQRWNFAIEGSGQGVWDFDMAARSVYYSPRWKSQLGYAAAEIGETFAEWESRVHPDDLPGARADLARHIAGETASYENRHRLRARDGSWRWILSRGMAVARDADGRPLRIVGTHADVTELFEAQQALADSEQRYRSMIAAMAEGMVVYDAAGRIIACNPAAETMFGASRQALLGRTALADAASPAEDPAPDWIAMREDGTLLPPAEHPAMQVLASGTPLHDAVIGVVQPRGTLVWLSLNAEPLCHAGETRPYAVVATFTDITQRRQHEESMRQSEARFRAIFDAAPAGVLMATTGGQIVQVNPAMTRLFGFTAGEMARMSTVDITDPVDRKATRDYLTELASGGRRSVQMEKRYLRKDGSRFWGSLLMTTLTNDSGAVIAVLAVVEDIDERHRARLAVEDSNRKLELSLAELARHDREIGLVNRLYAVLQASESEAEAYAALPAVLAPLFGERPGALAVRADGTERYTVVSRWGGASGLKDSFVAAECAALRADTADKEGAGGAGSGGSAACTHFLAPRARPCRCLPLRVRGGALGLLCVGELAPETHGDIGEVVAEALKLALSNLRLRHLLEHEASHDPLTGLFNRRSLSQMLPRELARARRGGDPLAVVMVDADHFKRFNDTYGHEAGDQALIQLSRVFRERLRQSDFAARYGGEEFVLVLPDTGRDGALELLADVAAAIATIRVHGAGITVSMGLAWAPRHGDTDEALLRAADAAVYRAKANGRNRVEVAEAADAVAPLVAGAAASAAVPAES